MKTFEGKVAIVTGGNSGIGAATARLLARDGAKVVIAARRSGKGEDLAREIGGFFIQTAGIAGPVSTAVADIEEAGWDEVMNINLKAVWLCMKYEIPAMLKSGGGTIVNVSSIYGSKPSELGHAPYCASKFAVIGLSKTAAIDYGQQGIRVNVVSPGFTHSEMVDPLMEAAPEFMKGVIARHSGLNRLGDSEESAEAITWLCSNRSRFVNGAVLSVDGGTTARMY